MPIYAYQTIFRLADGEIGHYYIVFCNSTLDLRKSLPLAGFQLMNILKYDIDCELVRSF